MDNTAATCEIVLAEVLQGVANDAEASRLEQLLLGAIVLPMDGAGPAAAHISRALRACGIAVKVGDLLICGTALVNGAAIMHRDKHLSQIAQIAGIEGFLA